MFYSGSCPGWGFGVSCLPSQLGAKGSGLEGQRSFAGRKRIAEGQEIRHSSSARACSLEHYPGSASFWDESSVTSGTAVSQGDLENCPGVLSCTDLDRHFSKVRALVGCLLCVLF